MSEIATIADAPEILDLQKLAYQSEAAIYNDYTIAPLRQTLAEMETDIRQQVVLKKVRNSRIIGSVRGYVKNGTGYIGRFIVHPDFQNQGIGSKLLLDMENQLGQASRFELFTGHNSQRNLYLYHKHGYHVFRSEIAGARLTVVYLEKVK
jgi:ribosomal protein S18 acetylase RimI-like enzyme